MFQAGYFLTRNATSIPHKPALVYEDNVFDYAVLNRMVNRLANNLIALGLRKGDRVAYLFPNSMEQVLIWYATQKMGTVAVPLNVYLLPQEIERIITTTKVRAVLYDSAFDKTARHIRSHVPGLLYVRHGEDSQDEYCRKDRAFEQLWRTGSDEEPNISLCGEDESLILFTSGTTGLSKGVMRTHQIVRDYALMMAIENDNSHTHEVLLTHCPLFHTAGISVLMKMAALGGTFILVPKVDPKNILEQIQKHRATQILMVPPVLYTRLTGVENWQSYDLSSVKEARASGGKIDPACAENLFALFPNAKLCLSYGSTEMCSPTSAVFSSEIVRAKPERLYSVGRLNIMNELRLLDDNGKEVPQGCPGEAVVRSSMVFKGYLDQPDLTERVLRDGWFWSGDILRRDKDGYYIMMGRKRDIVKTGGESVYAVEVENTLNEHPAVMECAVVGVPDAKFGEAVAVAVVLRSGFTLDSLDYEEILHFCKERMPSYCKPRYIAVVSELPKNSIGKIQKNILRETPEIFRCIA